MGIGSGGEEREGGQRGSRGRREDKGVHNKATLRTTKTIHVAVIII